MGTKMKGVLKGLRYITQIFEDEKQAELQIGFPTDVKHVAHIGWDGPSPSVDNSPSWMKEYKETERPQTANDNGKENRDLGRGSHGADSSTQRGLGPQTDPTRGLPDVPKSSRRNSLADGSSTSSSIISSKRSNKTKQSRKNSSNSSKSTRKQKDPIGPPGSNSPFSSSSQILPKKSSRKKSKEGGETCTISRTKATPLLHDSYTSPFSDPGPDIHDTRTVCHHNTFLQNSSLMRLSVKEEDKG